MLPGLFDCERAILTSNTYYNDYLYLVKVI